MESDLRPPIATTLDAEGMVTAHLMTGQNGPKVPCGVAETAFPASPAHKQQLDPTIADVNAVVCNTRRLLTWVTPVVQGRVDCLERADSETCGLVEETFCSDQQD